MCSLFTMLMFQILHGGGRDGNPLKPNQYSIELDGVTIVLDNGMDLTLGLACLVATYWAFGIQIWLLHETLFVSTWNNQDSINNNLQET